MSPAPGDRLGAYEVIDHLGAGGMGDVYRARDLRLDREVALKVVSGIGDDVARARLLREARLASSLDHPNICTVFDVGEVGGQAFIAMQLVRGETLRARARSEGLPVDQVIDYGAQIAAALAHAHEHGVVHRDLKLDNIVVTPDGRPTVLDFGIAQKLADRDLVDATTDTRSLGDDRTLAGTLHYLAPEVLTGASADARSDVWSLGVVLFEMATGRLPFPGRTGLEITSAILKDAIPALPASIPPGLARVIARCLAKSPGERPQRAGEVAAALEAAGADRPVPAPPPRGRALWQRIAIGVALLAVAALAGLVVARPWKPGSSTRVTPDSIAVLPLDNVSRDQGQEYLADGMTDALIAELGRTGAFRVTSRTSAMRFKGTKQPLRLIAEELDVRAVLEGSVLQASGRVRVTAQLVEASTDRTLWSGSYERDASEVLKLQGDVAKAIVTELRGRLTAQEESQFGEAQRIDPAAHETYLRARYQFNRRTEESLKKGLELFRQAIDLEPTYASAWAGLADCYLVLGSQAIGSMPAGEALPLAKAAATRALEIDSGLAEAHTSLGRALVDDWKLEEGEAEYRQALRINPSYATAHFWLAIALVAQERRKDALAQVQEAYRLDPVSPIIVAGVAFINHLAGRHDRALEYASKSLELDPNFAIGRMRLGVARLYQRHFPEAIAELERAVAASGGSPDMIGQLGRAHALAGNRDRAVAILAELGALRQRRYASSFNDALIESGLGNRDRAFEALDRAVGERYQYLGNLRVDPDLDALRADPRFAVLAARVMSGSHE